MNISNAHTDLVGWVRSVFCFVTQQRKPIKASTFKLFIPVLSMPLFLFVATPSQAEGLGRLFTTPSERVMLEKLRNPAPKKVQEEPEAEEVTVIPEEAPVIVMPRPDIPNITVNGLVKRSGGRSTAWVNGINTNTGNMETQYIEVKPHRIGKDHVHVEVDDKNIGDVSLKVGQSLDPDAAKITDTYQTLLGKPDDK